MKFFNLSKEWEINRSLPKEAFYRNIGTDEKLKRNLIDNVDKMKITYIITEANSNIPSYKDEINAFNEIDFIEIKLRKKDKVEVIAKLFHTSIPKHLVLVFKFGEELIISVADKYITDKVKVDSLYTTEWLDRKDFDTLKRFDIINCNNGNLRLFYENYISNIKSLLVTNLLQVNNEVVGADNIDKIFELNNEIEKLKLAMKREQQLNRQVELSLKLKKIKDEIKELQR